MLLDNRLCVFRLHVHIERVLRQDLDDGAFFTEPETARTYDLYIVDEFVRFDRTLQRAEERDTFVRFTGRTAANQNVMFISHWIFPVYL